MPEPRLPLNHLRTLHADHLGHLAQGTKGRRIQVVAYAYHRPRESSHLACFRLATSAAAGTTIGGTGVTVGGGNAGAFYAWATLLANIPIGEHQYFTSIKLRDIYLSNEVAEEDRNKVREASIRGFQAILDCFPDSQLFDATGVFVVSRFATLAFQEILDLGGVPQGDWELVTDSNGNPTAIRSTGLDTLSRDVQCFRNTVRIQ